MREIQALLSSQYWLGHLGRAVQGLLLAIPVAAVCEVAGWLVRRWVLKRLGPTFAKDAGRDAVERARRRRALRDGTVTGLRWLQNTAAVTIILILWKVDAAAVAILVLCGLLVAWGLLRDLVAGYSLLLDDCFAPGDEVVINGEVRGTVAECGWRRVRVAASDGGAVWVPLGEVRSVRNLSQSARAGET